VIFGIFYPVPRLCCFFCCNCNSCCCCFFARCYCFICHLSVPVIVSTVLICPPPTIPFLPSWFTFSVSSFAFVGFVFTMFSLLGFHDMSRIADGWLIVFISGSMSRRYLWLCNGSDVASDCVHGTSRFLPLFSFVIIHYILRLLNFQTCVSGTYQGFTGQSICLGDPCSAGTYGLWGQTSAATTNCLVCWRLVLFFPQ
jgi:hypothetical protein